MMALKAGRVGVNKSQVDEFGNILNGGSSVNVINNLNSNSTTDALSAKQGKVLKGLIDDLSKTNVEKHIITLSNSTLGINVTNPQTDAYYVEVGNKVIVFISYSTTSGGSVYTPYEIASGLPPCADFYFDLGFISTVHVDETQYNDLAFAIGTAEGNEGKLYQLNRKGTYTQKRYIVFEYYKKEV